MSGRATGDIVADLRNWRTLVVTKVGTDEGSGHAALQDEAADRLAELDADNRELRSANALLREKAGET